MDRSHVVAFCAGCALAWALCYKKSRLYVLKSRYNTTAVNMDTVARIELIKGRLTIAYTNGILTIVTSSNQKDLETMYSEMMKLYS